MTIDEAFTKILERNKDKEPCSASAVEMQAECGASIGEINARMRERYKAGEIGYFRAINGIRFMSGRFVSQVNSRENFSDRRGWREYGE